MASGVPIEISVRCYRRMLADKAPHPLQRRHSMMTLGMRSCWKKAPEGFLSGPQVICRSGLPGDTGWQHVKPNNGRTIRISLKRKKCLQRKVIQPQPTPVYPIK